MSIYDILIIVGVVVALIVFGLYMLNRWSSKKMVEQDEIVQRTRQPAEIFVIDKKMGKLTEANLPKAAVDQIPRFYKFMKTPLIKVKIGPQILTLLCDKRIYNALPVKKSVKVDIAGMYIVDMKGLKTAAEYKAQAKAKKEKAKQGSKDNTTGKKGKNK